MIDFQNLKFFSPSKSILNFQEVVKEVFSYLNKAPDHFYEIVVGCDSSSRDVSVFPVTLVVLRRGRGGRFFLTKINYFTSFKKKIFSLQERILTEVYLSCELALKFREIFKEEIKKNQASFNYQFQYIHADIGENGRTKDMIKEVVGFIKSNGFEAKIKPEAFAASVVADRFT